MSLEAKRTFFDGIADKWDGWEDLEKVAHKLSDGLDQLGVSAREVVVDVGCGTGNLTQALLSKLSPTGRVVAIDISSAMLSRAQEKVVDARVDWRVTQAERMLLDDGTVDRIICFSVWPHIDDPDAAIGEFKRVLCHQGLLHIWHLASRATINEIHASAGDAVADDVLVPAVEVAKRLEEHGFVPYEVVDDDERYLVSARLPPRSR